MASSLFLKTAIVGEETTKSGKAFHTSTILFMKLNFVASIVQNSFDNLQQWPLVVFLLKVNAAFIDESKLFCSSYKDLVSESIKRVIETDLIRCESAPNKNVLIA